MGLWGIVGIAAAAWCLVSLVAAVVIGHLLAGRPVRAVAALGGAVADAAAAPMALLTEEPAAV